MELRLTEMFKTFVECLMTRVSLLIEQQLSSNETLKWLCSGFARSFACAAVFMSAKCGMLRWTECVVGFPLTMTLRKKLLTVGQRILLTPRPRWRTLLTNRMLLVLRPARTVVRLFACLTVGLSAARTPEFTLPVMMAVSAAPFRFGGFEKTMRLSGLRWSPVVLTSMCRPRCMCRRL